MAGPLSEAEAQAFLAAPHVAVLSVASDAARPPLTSPIWYAYEPGGTCTFFTGTAGRPTRKARLIHRAGVVSLCVQREEPPYRYVTIEGAIVQVDRPPRAEQMLGIVSRYLPPQQAEGFAAAELGRPDSRVAAYTVRPDRWLSFDFGDTRE
jgi:nitroimidazol reductase NimA-like FMN-containing flavoprotein (pyridoxamine 5'-phosphate oxidase superfamily)